MTIGFDAVGLIQTQENVGFATNDGALALNLVCSRLRHARNRSVPIVGVETPDCEASVVDVLAACSVKSGEEPPVFSWDVAGGVRAMNPAASALRGELLQLERYSDDLTRGMDGCGRVLEFVSDTKMRNTRMVMCLVNAHRFFSDPLVIQGLANLREIGKQNQITIVLIGCSMQLPPEIAGDVLVIDSPLPDKERLRKIVDSCTSSAGIVVTEESSLSLAETVTGLSEFAAEQTIALAIHKDGVRIDEAWERKRKAVEQTQGLSVWRGGETFADIGGCDNIKAYLKAILGGAKKPNGIVFVDEIEKALAGSRGDTSGVSQDILGAVLGHMQDHDSVGMILLGPAGTSKSMTAKAAGNEAGIPTIRLDFGALKGSLVGASEAAIRQALKVIDGITNGSALWLSTCNSISDLPPELRRRFSLGTFFFDLPDAEERVQIWKLWYKKLVGGSPKDAKQRTAKSAGWTGAEIRQCCDIESRCGMLFEEASRFVVPISVSARKQVDDLRNAASGRFLSANRPGVFVSTDMDVIGAGRSINLSDE